MNEGQSWRSVATDALGGEPHGVFAVAWRLLRAPVTTVVRLSEDPSYKGHWRFMFAWIGAYLTLVLVIVPRLGKVLFGVPPVDRTSESLTLQGLQLAGLPILVAIQFYICRWLSPVARTPLSYVKMSALNVGFGWLIAMLVSLVELAVLLGFVAAGVPFDAKYPDLVQTIASMVLVLAFITAGHREFWELNWPKAIALVGAFAVLSWVIVYPALGWIAERLDIIGRLRAMLA